MDVKALKSKLQDPDVAWSVFNGEDSYGLEHIKFKTYGNRRIWAAIIEEELSGKHFLVGFESTADGLPIFRIPLNIVKVKEVQPEPESEAKSESDSDSDSE